MGQIGPCATGLIGPGCGGSSFTAGTKVLLASGLAIPIDKLKAGDKVLATNTKTGKTQPETVAAVLVHHDSNLYNLRIRAGSRTEVIQTTRNHLFWDTTRHQWIQAAALHPGDHLYTPGSTPATVIGGSAPAHTTGWMWDLTVPGNYDHDFYVLANSGHSPESLPLSGAIEFSVPILVHNCDQGEEIAQNIVAHTSDRVHQGDGTHYIAGVSPGDYVSYIHKILDGEVPGVETKYNLRGGRVGVL